MLLPPSANAMQVSRQKVAFIKRAHLHAAERMRETEGGELISAESSSLFSKATYIACKKSLKLADIVDRGVAADSLPLGQFGLQTNFFLRTEDVVKRMQTLLTNAFSLGRCRLACFVVDPHAQLMRTLRSASSVGALHAAWAALSERMDIARKLLTDYEVEHQRQQDDVEEHRPTCHAAHPASARSSPRTSALVHNVAPLDTAQTAARPKSNGDALAKSVVGKREDSLLTADRYLPSTIPEPIVTHSPARDLGGLEDGLLAVDSIIEDVVLDELAVDPRGLKPRSSTRSICGSTCLSGTHTRCEASTLVTRIPKSKLPSNAWDRSPSTLRICAIESLRCRTLSLWYNVGGSDCTRPSGQPHEYMECTQSHAPGPRTQGRAWQSIAEVPVLRSPLRTPSSLGGFRANGRATHDSEPRESPALALGRERGRARGAGGQFTYGPAHEVGDGSNRRSAKQMHLDPRATNLAREQRCTVSGMHACFKDHRLSEAERDVVPASAQTMIVLLDDAAAPAPVPPSFKSPAPALTVASAVELGGLRECRAELNARDETCESTARPSSTTTCSLAFEDEPGGQSIVLDAVDQQPVKPDVLEERTSGETSCADSIALAPLVYDAPCMAIAAPSPSILETRFCTTKTFALISAILRTQWIGYLMGILRAQLTPHLEWEREGISTVHLIR
ncbi:hypothetical protein B0H13DRAFT_1915242 [Mycena leptocephala]|nr:hypothetical protein B0H13DRAFT_1915242 [Mycena leptocephala]